MRCKPTVTAIVFLLVVSVPFYAECAKTKQYTGARRITDLRIEEGSAATDLLVKGNRLLTYTSFKQQHPLTLILYFSGTMLDSGETEFSPESDIVNSVKATHSVKTTQAMETRHTSKVEISLARDVVHEVKREGNALRISFPKNGGNNSTGGMRSVSDSGEALGNGPATRLQSVHAARLEDSLKVFIGADGAITNYKSFVIESPARIIFDIFNIKSPYNTEKLIAVNTKWVKKVRYFGYPDRLRVVLDTKKEYLSAFSAYPIDNGLLIHVGRAVKYATGYPSAGGEPMTKRGVASATELQSVYATQQNNRVLITVRADGPISSYTPSTIENPPSIVYDIHNVRNQLTQDSFPVDSKWVKLVHCRTNEQGVRITIDTQKRYLSSVSAYPDENGLVIQVGGEGAVEEKSFADSEKKKKNYDKSKPAWVDRIDFLEEDAGKSTLVIGTTRPVDYDMEKESDTSLKLKIYGARIPRYRQRPLITDRFESAVDNIEPIHKPAMKNSSVFDIVLREAVPHYVEQTENLITVHFEASSISPKPMVSSSLPSWKNVLGESDAAAESMDTSPEPVSGPATEITEGFDTGDSVADDLPTDLSMMKTGPVDEDIATSGFAVNDHWRASGPKVYSGEKIALDFYKTDIKNVFRILREVSGKNFAIEQDVTGEVTLTLDKPVPWDQVLDLILKMNKLGMTHEGDIIRIATRETLDLEEAERREAEAARLELESQIAKNLEEVAPLHTVYIAVSYSSAKSEIEPHLKKILTQGRGTLSVDDRTNTVILTDTKDVIDKAKEIVEKLDKVTPQVLIEARIVEANTTFTRSFGIQWGSSAGISGESDAYGTGPQRGYDMIGGTYGYDLAVSLIPSDTPTGAFGFNFARLSGSPLMINAAIYAAESDGSLKVISTPKIMTLDNKEAVISQGIEYPIWRYEDGNFVWEFKDITLELKVKPHVTPDNRITLSMDIQKLDLGTMEAGVQTFDKKNAETELLVNDGETVVIGGIMKTTQNDAASRVPGLSKIPILGWLFTNERASERKEELLIFITPKIVQLEQRLAF